MPFDINEIKSIIGRYGIAKTSTFATLLSPPSAVKSNIINDLPMLCDTVNLPGINFDLDQTRYKGYGLYEKRPTQASFEDITMTIIADGKGLVLEFIQKWMAYVMNIDGNSPSSSYGIKSEIFNFPADYYGTIDIYIYDVNGNKYQTYTMHQAFPVALGAIQMGWENVDSLMRIPVSFTYRSFTSNALQSLANTSSETGITNSNTRNIEKLEKIISDPNAQAYERYITV